MCKTKGTQQLGPPVSPKGMHPGAAALTLLRQGATGRRVPSSPGQRPHPIPSSLPSVPLGDGALPATSTMSPGTMSRARILCTPLRSARITFPISGSYSFKASMALSAFLSCKKQRSRAAAGGPSEQGGSFKLQRWVHPDPNPTFSTHWHHGWGKCYAFPSCPCLL